MKNNNKSKFVGVIIYAVMVVISLCIRTNPNNDLTVAGLRSMLIFIGCIAMLITRAIPMMFNCLLTLMVMAFFGCFGTGGVSSAWNSASMSTLISILCICCITSGLSHTTVPQRLGALAIRVSKGKTKLLILFLLEACAIVSTVMNDIAAIGCFTGIILGVIVAQGGPNNDRSKNKNLAKCLMIGLPIAGGLGGAASPAGSGANLTALSIVQAQAGGTIGFGQWMAVGLPMSIIGMVVVWLILITLFKPEKITKEAIETANRTTDEYGPWTGKDKFGLSILVMCIVLWVAGAWVPVFTTQVVAVIGACLTVFPGIEVTSFKELKKDMPWDTIFMVGFISGVVSTIRSTGASTWLVNTFLAPFSSWSAIPLCIMLFLLGFIIHIGVPSGAALSGLLTLPFYLLIESTGTLNPYAAVLVSSFCAGGCMVLPYDVLALLTFGYGYYEAKEYIKNGLICLVCVSVVLGVLLVPLSNLFL